MNPTFKIFAPLLKASMGPDGKKRFHGIASSSIRDRHGDTMTNSALVDMERSANQNMTIFLNHSYEVPEDVAGSVEMAVIRNSPESPDIRDLMLDIVVNEANERAIKAWEAIDSGTKLGLSIGAMIPEGGATRDRKTGAYTIDHVELLETSLVGVPANPRSWVEYAIKSLGPVSWVDQDVEGDTGEVVTRSDGETGVLIEVDKELTAESLEHTDDPPEDPSGESISAEMEGVEVPPDGTQVEIPSEGATTTNSANYSVNGDEAFTVTNPDLTNATVSVETPFANITVDTGNRGKTAPADGASQEAQLSDPENEDQDEAPQSPYAGILPVQSSLPEEDVETALQVLEPTVLASLQSSGELLRMVTNELIDTREALRVRNEEYSELEEMTTRVMSSTAEILDKVSSTPAGRRAVIREAATRFSNLTEVYGEDFVRLLSKRS